MDVLLVVLDTAKIRYGYRVNFEDNANEKIAIAKQDISQENFNLIKVICEKRGYNLTEDKTTIFIES